MSQDPFWNWCNEFGITHRKLLLTRTAGVDRISLLETVASGTVLASIPFRATIASQAIPLGVLPRRFPPLRIFARALSPLRPSAYELKCSWLAGMLAVLTDREVADYGPYLSMFPALGQLETRRQRSLPLLNDDERLAYDEMVKGQQLFVKHSHRLMSRCFNAPPIEAFQWAHDVVLQRAVTIPSYCLPSAPHCVGKFLTEKANEELEIPALVPLIDSMDFTRIDANCEIYTCFQSDFIHEATSQRSRRTTSNLSHKRRVVICAARDINSGEVLSAPSCKGIEPAACLFRFGELPEKKPDPPAHSELQNETDTFHV